ncbi:hypothetical protein GCM10023231_01050 [Olivibacter ginsenosidimutans]|uniref:DUF4296 domain-containing protein n=1 Tax=Olivibacter ginsenosidimutans TaxID=1176537 RepID=A0ABP9ABG5_9SPHI
MDYRIIIFVLSLCCFSFCSNPVSQTNYHVIGEDIDSLLSGTNDSLFHESKFVELMDTLRYPGKDYPVQMSLVEYYGTTGYTVSNIKCLLMQYQTRGVLSMFRYDYSSSSWERVKSGEMDLQNLKDIVRQIYNSPYWTSNGIDGEIMKGDVLSYRSIVLGKDDLINKLSIDPDEKLFDQIVELTRLNK